MKCPVAAAYNFKKYGKVNLLLLRENCVYQNKKIRGPFYFMNNIPSWGILPRILRIRRVKGGSLLFV